MSFRISLSHVEDFVTGYAPERLMLTGTEPDASDSGVMDLISSFLVHAAEIIVAAARK